MRPPSKKYEIDSRPILRVVDNIECPLKLLKELALLYSYDNKTCVHAKHNVIMIKLCVVEGGNPKSNHEF
jgi:hypothetical protein